MGDWAGAAKSTRHPHWRGRCTQRAVSLSPADQTRWFTEKVQVHEASLRAWLRSRFPSLPDIDDVVQESLTRVWQARAAGPIVLVKPFLFATARNYALDYFRRQQVVSIEAIAEIEALGVMEEGTGVPETVAKTQELELLTQAIQTLPDRCRQVLTLRKIYGLSQREIARQLGIAEHTVEAQVGIGVRRCAEFLARHGLP